MESYRSANASWVMQSAEVREPVRTISFNSAELHCGAVSKDFCRTFGHHGCGEPHANDCVCSHFLGMGNHPVISLFARLRARFKSC